MAGAEGQPGLSYMTADADGEGIALAFQAPVAGDITRICWKTQTVTTGGNILVQLETLDASGLPSGTLVAAGATATVAVNEADDSVWFSTVIGTPCTVTRGQTIAAVIKAAASFGASMRIATAGSTARIPRTYRDIGFPYSCSNTGSWAKTTLNLVMAVGFDNGAGGTVYYNIPCCVPATAITTNTNFDETDDPDEVGNVFTLPVTSRVSGMWSFVYPTADYTIKLYGPTTKTISVVGVNTYGANCILGYHQFAEPITLAADTKYRMSILPGASVIGVVDLQVDAAALMAAMPAGSACYWTQRTNAGSWTDTNTKRCLSVGLLIDQIDTGDGGTYPDESEVLEAVDFGPNGDDFTGTLAAGGGGGAGICESGFVR